MVLPTVPGVVLQTLREETIDKERETLLNNEDNEEVLFCEPPRGYKVMFTAEFILVSLLLILLGAVFIIGFYHKSEHKILFPVVGGIEYIFFLILFKLWSFDWCCYRVITNKRVAEVTCHNNFLVSKTVKYSKFTTTLVLLLKKQLNVGTDKTIRNKTHLAHIIKYPNSTGGKAIIFGHGSQFTFRVRDINLLEIEIINKKTQNWPSKPFTMKVAQKETSSLGYYLGFSGLLFSGGLATASYFLSLLPVLKLETFGIPIGLGAVYCFVFSIAFIISQFEDNRAIESNSSFHIGDFAAQNV